MDLLYQPSHCKLQNGFKLMNLDLCYKEFYTREVVHTHVNLILCSKFELISNKNSCFRIFYKIWPKAM